jgi:hypothetical protein
MVGFVQGHNALLFIADASLVTGLSLAHYSLILTGHHSFKGAALANDLRQAFG